MAGSTLRVDVSIDDKAIQRRLESLIKRGEDLSPLLVDIGEYLELAHRDRWDKEIAPDGSPWQPLAYETSEQKERKGKDNGILLENADLRDLLRYQVANNILDYGTDRIYGATHQFGDEDRDIPQREWLGFSDLDLSEIGDIVTDYLRA